MQSQNELAVNFLKLFDIDSYDEFEKGFFVKQPQMSGYYYLFKNMKNPKICVVVNTSSVKYPSSAVKTEDFVFVIFNVPSIEEFMSNLANKYLAILLENTREYLKQKSTRNLPYGYYLDENQTLKIDMTQADEVRKIYNLYIDTRSVRAVANKMKTNFSDIREILHDFEKYAQMQPPILSNATIKEVGEILVSNVRGGAVAKKSTEDEIRDVRRQRKERMKQLEQN